MKPVSPQRARVGAEKTQSCSPSAPSRALCGETDFAVFGAGLAGSTLAWRLAKRGASVVLIDRDEPVTSSKVAAGLITPLTGKKLAKAAGFDADFAEALAHYRAIEAATGHHFFHAGETVRVFATESEARTVLAKASGDFAGMLSATDPPTDPVAVLALFGSVTMAPSARLDVPAYLAAVRGVFASQGCFHVADVALPDDLELGEDGVTLPRLGLAARRVVFCQGFAANPYFADVRFHPSRGDILTVRVPGLAESRTLNRHGTWLTPLGDGTYRAGSTYDHDTLTNTPTAAGRARVLADLAAFVVGPVEVLKHDAAVRPVIRTSRPVLGVHPTLPRLAFFNGLGSKGALLAPAFAAQLVRHLLDGEPLDPAADLRFLGRL